MKYVPTNTERIKGPTNPPCRANRALRCKDNFLKNGTISLIDAVTSSGILKAKQKLGVTFNSDKLERH